MSQGRNVVVLNAQHLITEQHLPEKKQQPHTGPMQSPQKDLQKLAPALAPCAKPH